MSGHCRGRIPGHDEQPSTRCPNAAVSGGLCPQCDKKTNVRKLRHRGPSQAARARQADYIRELESDLETMREWHDLVSGYSDEMLAEFDAAMCRTRDRSERVRKERR